MNRFRLPLIIAGVVFALVVLAVAVVFNASFQTWAARKAIASQPGLRLTVGKVSAGMNRVDVSALQFEQDGAVLTVPAIEAELPLVSAAVGKNVAVSRLVARGWTLDLSKAGGSKVERLVAKPPSSDGASTKRVVDNALHPHTSAAAQAFAGIFTQLQLPVDVSVDGVDLEGEVILPDARGRTKVTIKGGGLGAKRQGKFDLVANANLVDPQVNAVELRGELVAAMDTPRTFTGLSAKLNAAASGAKFPRGVKLTADLAATQSAAGEAYSAAVVAEGQEIVNVRADFPKNATRLDGTWKLDVRDVDVAPFALGQPLPAFTAVGEGKFDTSATFSDVHAVGRLNATAARLEVVRAELAALGELKIAATFDLAQRGGTLIVQTIETALSGAEPIATLRSLQPFEFNPKSGELRATDAARELLGIVLQGVPVAWAKPFLTGVELSGGYLRGELLATPRGGGVSLRSTKPLTVDGIGVAPAGPSAEAGTPFVRQIDISVGAVADYTPQGWQAELGGLTAKSGDTTLLTLNLRAGQLAGAAQPLKAAGKLDVNLPALLTQPAAAGLLQLNEGDASIDFAASVNGKREIQAKVALRNLVTTVDAKPVKLPALSADIRADIDATGKVAFSAPLLIERNDRKSDLAIVGSIGPEKDKARAIEAQLSSTQLLVEDAQMLAAMVPEKEKKPADPAMRALPPWAGFHGSVTLQLKRVIYSDTFEASNIAGRLRIDAGMLKLEGLQAGLGETGRANLNGTVTFNASGRQPYALTADLAVKDFESGSLFRAINPAQPPTIEGRFDIASKLAARGARLGDLALGAGGEFQLTSKGGVFRGLPVNVSNLVENTSKLAGWIATAGTAISSITGKKDYAEIANKTQAVAELAKGWHPIAYDQLSVLVSRDAALNTTLKNFTLIAPEVRLTGSGTALHQTGASILEDPLAMEFMLRARGRQGELLKYLGMLEAQPDDFGYTACVLPLRITGTMGKPDTSELNGKLVSLALEKAGVTDKAADLVNRIFGGGK